MVAPDLLNPFLAFAGAVILAFLIARLSRNHGLYIRMTWLAFSLTFTTWPVLLEIAVFEGAISERGHITTPLGAFVINFAKFVIDLNHELLGLAALHFVIVAPQTLTYLLTCLSGNAAPVKLVKEGMSFSVIVLVKALAGAAGLLLSVLVSLSFYGWGRGARYSTSETLATVVGLLLCAFLLIQAYVERQETLRFASTLIPVRIKNGAARFHRWAQRNRSPQIGGGRYVADVKGILHGVITQKEGTCTKCGTPFQGEAPLNRHDQ